MLYTLNVLKFYQLYFDMIENRKSIENETKSWFSNMSTKLTNPKEKMNDSKVDIST